MSYIRREIEKQLMTKKRGFPVLILTGPRRSGKTTLLRNCFPEASYHLLEDLDLIARVKSDPRSFIEGLRFPVILDEIQNVPELLNAIRAHVDRLGKRTTQWFLTGSQEPALMKGVSESMTGRAAIFSLLPFSCAETKLASLFRGGFPEVVTHRVDPDTWFRSYIQTYLERDIRALSSLRNLSTFRRFLLLVASRTGQMLNRTDLAAPLGISVPTVTEWIGLLEATHQIILVPPFYENFGKRLVKSPKIYFADSGLAVHLLGLESEKAMIRSPFMGALFENLVASEIVKAQLNRGKRKDIYYFRDRLGLEVDFLVPTSNRGLTLLEAKASKTIRPEDALSMVRLQKNMKQYSTRAYVVCLPSLSLQETDVVQSGVKAIPYKNLHATC